MQMLYIQVLNDSNKKTRPSGRVYIFIKLVFTTIHSYSQFLFLMIGC